MIYFICLIMISIALGSSNYLEDIKDPLIDFLEKDLSVFLGNDIYDEYFKYVYGDLYFIHGYGLELIGEEDSNFERLLLSRVPDNNVDRLHWLSSIRSKAIELGYHKKNKDEIIEIIFQKFLDKHHLLRNGNTIAAVNRAYW